MTRILKAGLCLTLCAVFSFAGLPARADIVIPASMPLSGGAASFGEEMRAGAELAVENINAAGGALGEELVVRYHDDACSATAAVLVANRIAASSPPALLSHTCSSATLAALPVYAEIPAPELTISSNPEVTAGGHGHLFRINGRDDQQAPTLAVYMAKTLAPQEKIAVIDDRSSWGAGYAYHAADALTKAGHPPSLRDSVTAGQKDFSALIARLKKDGIENVVIALYATEAGLLVRQARAAGFKGNFYGGDAIQTPEFWKIAGPAAEGTIMSGVYDPRVTEEGREIADELKSRNKPVGVYGFYAYASLEVLAEAMNRAGSKDPAAITAALREEKFDTIIGPVSWDGRGELENYRFQLFQWHNGDFSPLEER